MRICSSWPKESISEMTDTLGASFQTGKLIQVTITDDTVYVSIDGNVVVRAKAQFIALNMSQDHRPTNIQEATP